MSLPPSRPRPLLVFEVRSWDEQAESALGLILEALERLQAEARADANFPDDEVEVSLCLSGHLHDVVNERGTARGVTTPGYDGLAGRDRANQGDREYEKKRPDIRWRFIDPQETRMRWKQKVLDVECKRLGEPPSRTHLLNEKYVTQGIVRFQAQSHRYGDGSAWATMIGYVQSSTFDAIWNEVNTHTASRGLPNLNRLHTHWQGCTSHLDHRLNRSFEISPLHLRHFWVDLRPQIKASN